MIKRFGKFLLAACIGAAALCISVPVFASAPTPNFTGWYLEGSTPIYYSNGNKVADVWVKYGNVVYYIGSDGLIVPDRVVSVDSLNEYNISYIDGNAVSVQSPVTTPAITSADVTASIQNVFQITDDYQAFKALHPEYVAAYGNDSVALKNLYLSTYGGITPGRYYLDAISRYGYGLYNTHHYTFRYANNGDGTHNAYCACGEYIVETCDSARHFNDDCIGCSRCEQHFEKIKKKKKD